MQACCEARRLVTTTSEGAPMMNMSRSCEQQLLKGRGNVLKTAALGLVGAVIFGLAMAIGYQAEKQVSR